MNEHIPSLTVSSLPAGGVFANSVPDASLMNGVPVQLNEHNPIPEMTASPNEASSGTLWPGVVSSNVENNPGAVAKKYSGDCSPNHEDTESVMQKMSCFEIPECIFSFSDSDSSESYTSSEDESMDEQQEKDLQNFLSPESSFFSMETNVFNSIIRGDVESLSNHLSHNNIDGFNINTVIKIGDDIGAPLALSLEHAEWGILDFLLRDAEINIDTDMSPSVYERYNHNDNIEEAKNNLINKLIEQAYLMKSPYIAWFTLNKYLDTTLNRDFLDAADQGVEEKYAYYANLITKKLASLIQ